ncbi:MAG: response regulator [Campylobacterales bacterium]|nr:response regulator [Campylobacterales bacterium]
MINLKKLIDLSKELNILYVEDDSTIRASMTLYLLKIFSNLSVANDGVDGLQLYETQKFDIVITDLSMPRMNGLEMIVKIKELHENQAILITTAHAESEYMLKSIKLGIDGYIIKPFEYEQLNHELYKIVEKLSKYAENEEYKKMLLDMVEKKTSDITQMMLYQNDNYEKTLLSMVEMIEDRDTYTAGHSKRVAQYCQKIAQQMGYGEEECAIIYQAGILHDIGKVATPDAVLLNPKGLNEIEYKLIQEHVEVGYKLLGHIPMFASLAEIVHSHHERFDGNGYPRGVQGNEIHPLSRIMMVADAFDAMTTNRIYKARKSVQEALDELIGLKSLQFHPEVVDYALVALKDITIDENISQVPRTKLEQERFAYFYKDRLTNVYNQNYLEIVLMKNSYEKEFKTMDILFLNHFSTYNKQSGWDKGDTFLHVLALSLNEYFKNSLVFRIFGDDFVVLSKEKVDLAGLNRGLDTLMQDTCIEYKFKSVDLETTKIETVAQIEHIS